MLPYSEDTTDAGQGYVNISGQPRAHAVVLFITSGVRVDDISLAHNVVFSKIDWYNRNDIAGRLFDPMVERTTPTHGMYVNPALLYTLVQRRTHIKHSSIRPIKKHAAVLEIDCSCLWTDRQCYVITWRIGCSLAGVAALALVQSGPCTQTSSGYCVFEGERVPLQLD